MSKVLIVGATSAIAQATAKHFAKRGDELFLVARNTDKLAIVSEDLKVLGASVVNSQVLDLDDHCQHQGLMDNVIKTMGGLDTVLIAHGTLPKQEDLQSNYENTLEALTTNGLSVISLCTILANYFEQQKSGTIAVISSVAGDRGRGSNYVYGTAKAMVSVYLQGLRNRLFKSGVHVLTVKPGFVDTPMTAEFEKGLLWAKPDAIADSIVKGIDKKRNEIYAPFFWRYIMLIIKSIPEFLFKKLSL